MKIKYLTDRVPNVICPYCGESNTIANFLRGRTIICPDCERRLAEVVE